MREVTITAGLGVGVVGAAVAGLGVWARRDVGRALSEERIPAVDPTVREKLVTSARGARATAELIRSTTLEATGGRTYAEIEPYLTEDGTPTGDPARAAKHELTGQKLANPQQALWVQSLALQTALMQAYMAFRLAELNIAIGVALATAGAGLVAAGCRRPAR